MGRGPFAALLVVILLPATAQAAPEEPADRLPPAAHADRDADGLDDALEHHLAELRPQDRVDVIVQVRPGADAGGVAAAHDVRDVRRFRLVEGFAGRVTAARAQALARAADVVRVQQDAVVTLALEDARADTGADRVLNAYGLDGTGVGVCVIDTGVDPTHEQLDSKAPVPFFDAVNGHTTAYDDHWHGTHVAGTAVGDGTGPSDDAERFGGVAPGADLYAAKVLSAEGSGSESQIIAGIDWCADQPGVDILSMSLGSSLASDGLDAMSVAVNNAVAAGKVAVVAAGNAGSNRQTIGSPGAAVRALTVGAAATWSGPASTGTPNWYGRPLLNGVYLAPFSSRGPTVATDGTAATRRIKPDVVAPGVAVTAAYAVSGGYATASGTSMATPFVSGALALALEADPALTATDLERLVARTVHDRGWPGKDDDWGWGLLDAWALVSAVRGETAATPVEYPGHHAAATVPGGASVWSHDFDVPVSALDIPIAVTMLTAGHFEEVCWGGWICFEEWTLPDLDTRLVDPDGLVVDTSTCGLDCGEGTEGNQETLTAVPTKAGTWTVEVYPFEDGPGGEIVLDISVGPLPGGDVNYPTDRPPREVATLPVHVGALDAVVLGGRGTWSAAVTVTVVDADGVPVARPVVVGAHWDDGARTSCTAEDGACVFERGGLPMRDREIRLEVDGLVSGDGLAPYVVWERGADETTAVTLRR